ncbi:2,4-dienoyl-CoA reductase-like NADH-dependent reductase (Old Yellow Enzyme family) [Sphingomonas sp. SORGH_AS802]|uniref:NADH:flavin oxidoreductase/NADH oxidase n=1 Tax=unclassified Sphingomonas TaxID=196159 RepID=UPI0028542E3B|nr:MULTISPECIES: NADH:flavin oxidoreductase/NADH oxidase [unclassified Sphingomonas]MDR6126963.1 2,4-dienoyl-CoA reductase-like NADH-dependent reductase (Old Yellow Enzyme family) [Sphingomonas sp. SORGH_AS_0438]MDR6134674.1 2,4-dienoyl-CoA reductase-like NADH-dependent reductase (Old Yellow Enzyme family) [Sphingomonas sp. SORGH_AS_0802]
MNYPQLFQSLDVGPLRLDNRIVIAPMCQYSAENGCMTDWHLIHLGHLALSGAALLTIEATAVVPEGRITYADVGLWDDATEAAMARVVAAVRRHSAMPIAIQLAHAGRKASTDLPWRGGRQIAPDAANGWPTVAPSALAFADGETAPAALDQDGIARVRDGFVEAAKRAARIGIDAIQLHGAHGYLIHQFLSPLSNRREDAYGGSLENRMRLPLEIFDAVRAAVSDRIPVTMRVSGTDWVEGGWDIDQTVAFAQALEARGCAAMHVSSGGLDARQQIPVGPNYQVPLARAVKQAVGIPVVAVGQITEYEQAEAIVATGDADLIGLARTILYDPRWPWHAAAHLGGRVSAPDQYLRSQPSRFRHLFDAPADTARP